MSLRWPMPRQGSVTLHGDPVPASRPRVVRVPGGFTRTHYPAAHVRWESGAVEHLRLWWGSRPALVGPVALDAVLVFSRPANRTPRDCGGTLGLTGRRELALLCGTSDVHGRLPAYTEAADVDNVAKLLMDALQKAGVVTNDSRIVELHATKVWCALTGDRPCIELAVYGQGVLGG